MSRLKRFIVKLFNIQQEDLLTNKALSEDQFISRQEIRTIIREEFAQQIEESIQHTRLDSLTPFIQAEIRSAIEKNINNIPLLTETREPEPLHEESLEIDQEFPILDEIAYRSDIDTVEQSELLLAQPIMVDELEQDRLAISEDILPLEEAVVEPFLSEDIPALSPLEINTTRIGIDFGTTTTSVSIKFGDNLPEALAIGADGTTRYIPSVVYFQPGVGNLASRVLVGEEAENSGDQTHVIRSIKRCIACDGTGCQDPNPAGFRIPGLGKSGSPSRPAWCGQDGKIMISETESMEPLQIATLIVREALLKAIKVIRERYQIDLTEENVGFLPLNLGCGARFNLKQREILLSVVKELGFRKVSIENVVEEPILAGFAFSRFAKAPEGKALIYDFGGGTFDVAFLSVDRADKGVRVTVLTTAGENWLGGDDIDTLVERIFVQKISITSSTNANEIKSRLTPLERTRLRLLARQAKETLSISNSYSNVLLSENLGIINLDLSRDEFEAALADSGLVQKSLEAVRRALQLSYAYEQLRVKNLIDAQEIIQLALDPSGPLVTQVDKVILVGGVTKIPFVRKQLQKIFENKIIDEKVIEPILAVVLGGAYPREPQHFSMTTPPYGFYIQGKNKQSGKIERHDIFRPYEYYNFHGQWPTKAYPEYQIAKDLKEDLDRVSYYYERVDSQEPHENASLGGMQAGTWRFSIHLDGSIFMEMNGGKKHSLGTYPIIHPIQQAILDEREKRSRIDIDRDTRTFEEAMKDTMNEN